MRILLKNFCLLLPTRANWKYNFSLLVLITVCQPLFTSAQNIVWDKTIGANDNDYLETAQQTSDGGYILGGSSGSPKSGDKSRGKKGQSDYWLVKLNPDGSKEWDITIGGNRQDKLQVVYQTPDGGYILGGASSSDISGDKTEAQSGYWIVKLNANGTKIWDKTIPIEFYYYLIPYKLQLTSDGGFLLAGQSDAGINQYKSEPSKGSSDLWLLKLNPDGTKAWDKTIGGTGPDSFRSIEQTKDGGYIVGSYSYSGKGADKTEEATGFWLVKLNADRTKAWDKIYQVNHNFLKQTPDGGYILGGSLYDKEQSKEGNEKYNYGLLKLKADGTKEWDKTIGGLDNDELHDLELTRDGGYLLGGGSSSNTSNDKTQNSQGSFDYWVVKVNSDQSIAWDLTLGTPGGDKLQKVLQTEDGGYFIAGYSPSNISGNKSENSKGLYDYWVIKLDNSERQKQTITFEPIPDVNFTTQKTVTLKASASSGLPVSYGVISGPATVKNNTLTLTGGSGTVTVKAMQAGNQKFFPAIEDTARFIVQVPPVTRLWDKAYGGIPTEYYHLGKRFYGTSTLSAMVGTPDGGYLLGGTSDSNKGNDKTGPARGKSDFWIVKTDAAGKKLWDKTYGGKDSDGLTALIPTSDGGYLLGGTSRSNKYGEKSQNSRGVQDYWVVKIDANGNKLWDKTFGGSNSDALSALVATPDGSYLLGGTSASGKEGDKTESNKGNPDVYGYPAYDYWVVKIDEQGNKLWDKTFGGQNSDKLSTLVITSKGEFLLGGTSDSGINADKSENRRGEEDYWVVKVDANGNKLWDKTFGGSKKDQLSAVVITPDGGFLLGGTSTSGKGADKSEATRDKSGSNYKGDYWLIKTDTYGNKLWDKTLGGNNFDQLTALITTPDGGYLLGGNSQSDISGEKSEESRTENNDQYVGRYGRNDFWLVKLDAQANKMWDRTLGTYVSKYSDLNSVFVPDELSTLLATPDGGYLVGGTTHGGISGDKSQPLKGVRDSWVVKIKEETKPESLAWDMCFGGSGDDIITTVIETSDGGYLTGGYSYSGLSGDKTQDTQGRTDYWIVKADKNGKKLWDKRYGGSGDDFLNRVIQTKDGGYLLAGSSRSGKNGDKTEANRDAQLDYFGERDFWLVKVDSLGNKQWDKTLGGSGFDELIKVIQLSSGEYVLAGYSNSPVSGEKSQGTQGGYDYWLVKVSAKGTKIWDKRFGGTLDEVLGSFTQTQDDGFLLGGTSQSDRNRDKSEMSRGKSDYWIVRTDKDGNKLWDKTFGGKEEDKLNSLGQSNGGTFFLAGTSWSPKSGDKSQANYLDEGGFASSDYWLIKIDAQGNKVWDKTIGGNSVDGLNASTYTREGSYVLAGTSSSIKSGDKTENGKGLNDYWVVKLDASGSKQWDKTIGGKGEDILRTVLQTNDGGLLLGGVSESNVSGDKTQPNQGRYDYWLVKLAPETASLVAPREAIPAEEPFVLTNSLIAYPNPVREKVTIKFTLPQTEAATVKIYDSQGQEVTTLFRGEAKAKQTYQLEWQASTKPAGLYFLQLQTPTLRQQQKLLLTM
ncbi:hypothetical protein AHMF7605_10685 [Adhaeribacter arboris]|uniref:Secretion system C-terminal sorting domain-containing protein n=1 Tax=Adhaeribacter arboris TaxID=2072846 RepID=A0A2T2YEK9_9BACT|nr:T9SS type A sorting domain-containing protein [Adhaeribacter arboris]PSR53950.1 hypothetical protein AHMF7605_10685 [Adhaeribacter arboris]